MKIPGFVSLKQSFPMGFPHVFIAKSSCSGFHLVRFKLPQLFPQDLIVGFHRPTLSAAGGESHQIYGATAKIIMKKGHCADVPETSGNTDLGTSFCTILSFLFEGKLSFIHNFGQAPDSSQQNLLPCPHQVSNITKCGYWCSSLRGPATQQDSNMNPLQFRGSSMNSFPSRQMPKPQSNSSLPKGGLTSARHTSAIRSSQVFPSPNFI